MGHYGSGPTNPRVPRTRSPLTGHPLGDGRSRGSRMVSRVLGLVVVSLLVAVWLRASDQRGPSTPEERARALQMIHELESDPLSSGAKEERQWLTLWLIAVPDIHVALCTEFYPPLLGAEKNYASELLMQGPYSMAAFEIQHPDQAADEASTYLAGVEGTLRAYEAILQKKPKARWPVLDDLLAKREKGELAAFVRETVPRCKSK